MANLLQFDYHTQVKNAPVIDVGQYVFSWTNGNGVSGSLSSAGVGKVLTFRNLPHGLAVGNRVYISGGTGTAEAVAITATSGTVGGSGTITVTTANTHTGSWAVSSASFGLQESAVVANLAGGGTIIIPAGTFTVNATVRIYSNTTVMGAGIYGTMIQRTGNFGDTIVAGTASAGVTCVRIQDMLFMQVINYVAGAPPTVSNKPTSGAHIDILGGNTCQVIRCRFQDLVFGIRILGGAVINIEDCEFLGLWSNGYAQGQITQADIITLYDSVLGIPTYIVIRNCLNIGGYRGPANEVWGSQVRIYLTSGEDIEIAGGSCAAAALNGIQIAASSISTILANIRIHDVRFDGTNAYEIDMVSDGTASASLVSISNNIFNGEALGLGFAYSLSAVNVADFGSGVPCVIGLEVSGNLIFNYYYSGINVLDGAYWNVHDNVIYMYNVGVGAASSQASGVYIAGRAKNGLIANNLIGGDNTGNSVYGAGNNHCLFGISVQAPASANAQVTLCDNYPPTPAAIGTADDQMFVSYKEKVFFIPSETGANNAIAGYFPNIPLIDGLQVEVYLAHTLQAGANTFALNGGAARSIKSAFNPNNDISAPCAIGGMIRLIYRAIGPLWLAAGQ